MGTSSISHPAAPRLHASMAKPKRDSLPHYEHLIFYVKLAAALIVVCISALTAAYMRNRNPNGWVAEQRQPMWSPKLEKTTRPPTRSLRTRYRRIKTTIYWGC